MTDSFSKKRYKSPLKIFTGLSSFEMLAMFRRGLFYTFLSIYLREFLQMSVFETTLYATLPMIASVIFQNFVWGPFSDKFQRRRTLIILGEILAGIGTLTIWAIHFSFTNLYFAGYVIIIGLTIVEMFWSMSNIAWSALLSDLYPSEERSKIMGQLTSLGGLGRIIGIFIGGFLYDSGFGFRNGSLFFVASLVMIISTIPMLMTPEGGIDLKKQEETGLLKQNEITYKKQKSVLIFIVFVVALIFINFGRNSIAVPYSQYLSLNSGFNLNSVMLSFVANSRSVAVMITGFTAGFLSKKLGHSKALIFGTMLGIIALLITATTIYLEIIFIGSFLIGAAEVIITASSYAMASVLIPARIRAKLFAVYNTTFFLSWGSASTLIAGPLIDLLIKKGKGEVFAYKIAFLVGALICLIGLFIFIFLELWLIIQKRKNIQN
ncbi:MAG: MFS transporter [Promethearchaeota archaeon]